MTIEDGTDSYGEWDVNDGVHIKRKRRTILNDENTNKFDLKL